MKQMVKTAGSGLAVMCVCLVLLVATACIPREMIQKQSEKSAEYFSEQLPFPVLFGNYINAIQDNYSDTLLCDILYCIDTSHPFTSVIRARYVQGEKEEAYAGYLAAVKEGREPDREYGRYWHGTMVLLRPLMLLIPIGTIRILFGASSVLLQVLTVGILWKRKKKTFCVCYLLGFLLIHPWMLFTSLEYSTAFLAASAASLIAVKKPNRTQAFTMPFFAAVGVITCFVDFLTTETLTFTLPMLLILADDEPRRDRKLCKVRKDGKFRRNENGKSHDAGPASSGRLSASSVRSRVAIVIRNGLCWLGGYLGMFALKIGLLAAVAGKEVLVSSMNEGFLRLGGTVPESNFSFGVAVDPVRQFSGAVWHNLACLYPVHTGKMESPGVWLVTFLILAAGLAAVYLLHDMIDSSVFIPVGLLALLPYIRFLALSNHSYLHFFITYRAQMVTIVVFTWFVFENGLERLLRRRKGGIGR